MGLRVFVEQKVESPENEHESLTRSWTSNDLCRPSRVSNRFFLGIVELREGIKDSMRNPTQSNPSLRKLKTFSFVTIR